MAAGGGVKAGFVAFAVFAAAKSPTGSAPGKILAAVPLFGIIPGDILANIPLICAYPATAYSFFLNKNLLAVIYLKL
ncbi:hypothetical protein DPQ22_01055 [Candidatus Tokpelaia sp.]|nr:hypothetical protein DPQ22_01055 [Candidatus Tokpelaia sp.]